jgi:hypothetical protein
MLSNLTKLFESKERFPICWLFSSTRYACHLLSFICPMGLRHMQDPMKSSKILLIYSLHGYSVNLTTNCSPHQSFNKVIFRVDYCIKHQNSKGAITFDVDFHCCYSGTHQAISHRQRRTDVHFSSAKPALGADPPPQYSLHLHHCCCCLCLYQQRPPYFSTVDDACLLLEGAVPPAPAAVLLAQLFSCSFFAPLSRGVPGHSEDTRQRKKMWWSLLPVRSMNIPYHWKDVMITAACKKYEHTLSLKEPASVDPSYEQVTQVIKTSTLWAIQALASGCTQLPNQQAS